MKMVSAAKLKGDEGRLNVAKPFAAWTFGLSSEPKEMEFETYENFPQKVLIVPFSSDKGLCGGINTYISRAVRDCAKKLIALGKECDVVCIGDKGRSQLARSSPEMIKRSLTEIISPGTFALASSLAEELIAAGAADYDGIVLMYNSFVNPAVYKQKYKLITPLVTEASGGNLLSEYEFDANKGEFVQDMYEYLLATQMFHSFMDGAASEQSSRMTAMENASQNAADLINKLTLKYNRARQARITTELIEIISGASAIEDS
jgi:F-type H+-transporting ATPase subunit gamma